MAINSPVWKEDKGKPHSVVLGPQEFWNDARQFLQESLTLEVGNVPLLTVSVPWK